MADQSIVADHSRTIVDDEFATLEPWEHENQRELSLLYNHHHDDSLQFNRGHMREAIQHGRNLANRQIREIVAALKPFANAARRLAHYGDVDEGYQGTNHRLFASTDMQHLLELLDGIEGDQLTIGHLVAAREALSATKEIKA